MVVPTCTVRGCGQPLAREDRSWSCAAGHRFDVARRGWVNLLQPQDKRSKTPGDSKDVVAARRRLLDAGVARPLIDALGAALGAPRSGDAILDVGCGEGTALAALAARFTVEGWGLDLSAAAIDAAAARHPAQHWVVANADRALPFADASFARVLSITARRHAGEMRRVLAPDGRLVVAVPAEDDQRELREAVQGAAHQRDRMETVERELAPRFALEATSDARQRLRLEPPAIADLLATGYRGARHRERERAATLGALDVTLSWRIGVFRPR